jgi:hypothetical protein
MTRLRAFAIAVAAAAVLGCTERLRPPAEPGPAGDRAGDFIPGDLDAVVRVDLDAGRRLFGATAVRALMIDVVDPEDDPATANLLSKALEHATTVFVAFRPGLSARTTDHVTVFHGNFRDVDPRSEPKGDWRPPLDLGGGFQLYDRPQPKRRSAPARIYTRASDWLVFVSAAEIDSAERVIERRADDEHVDPPDRGVLSYAFRAEPIVPLLGQKFSAVAEALRGATNVSGSVAADERGLRATLEVAFTNEADAVEAGKRAEAVISALRTSERLLGVLAKGARVSPVGSTMVVRIELDARGLSTVIECATREARC